MNTRSIAMIAILAVAAVAVVGAGYAYYWGQAEITGNQADVEYIAVQTDATPINVDVDFNSKYASSMYTITPAGYEFETIDGKSVTPVTKDATGAASGLEFTLKAPIPTAADSYDFQVKITNATLGTNATLYFGLSDDDETEPEELFQLYPTGTAKEYVAVLPANQLTETPASSGLFEKTQYGFIYLAEEDAVSGTGDGKDGIQVDDVAKAKCSIDAGAVQFQAMKNKVAQEIEGLVVTYSELDGFTPTATGGVYKSDDKTLTFNVAGTYLVKYTNSADVFYEVIEVSAAP